MTQGGSSASTTGASATPEVKIDTDKLAQKPLGGKDQPKAAVSEKAQGEPQMIAKEERVEYRDQNGNLLNEEQVKALEGKVEFQTKYETKTRLVDQFGNEIYSDVNEAPAGVAPPHPDVQGVDSETVKGPAAEEGEGKPAPPPQDAAASQDGHIEAERNQPRPASEGKAATVQDDEL